MLVHVPVFNYLSPRADVQFFEVHERDNIQHTCMTRRVRSKTKSNFVFRGILQILLL